MHWKHALLFSVFSLLQAVVASGHERSCEEWTRFAAAASEAAAPFQETLPTWKNSWNDADVLLIREYHTEETYRLHADLLPLLEKIDPRFDCAFLEAASDMQPLLDGFARGEVPFYKYLSPLFMREDDEELENHYYRIPIDAAIRNGWKSIDADLESARLYAPDFAPMSAEGISIRNQAMAERISRAVSSGECKKSVFIVGSKHLARIPGEIASVPDLLKEKGIASAQILMMALSESSYFSQDLCPEAQDVLKRMPRGSAFGVQPLLEPKVELELLKNPGFRNPVSSAIGWILL